AHDKEGTRADVPGLDWLTNDWLAPEGTRMLPVDQSGADTSAPLLFVACKGDVAGVKEVLDEDGVDVNSIDLDGRTALHIAASEGHVEVVKFLLSRKANIDARDRYIGSNRVKPNPMGNHTRCQL
ncbi:serine/threonine-protein kinase STY17-like protein isoform X1, partial [Tanacetum coccineum]